MISKFSIVLSATLITICATFHLNPATPPEPSSLAIIGIAVVIVLLYVRR
jgi:hypothetical protein